MAYLVFDKIGITAIAAAVPKRVIDNKNYTHFMTNNEVELLVKMTGIAERRFADEKTCSSDLCIAAAENLFTECSVDKNEIDVLIFVSQTPDYRTPPTAMMIQNRLGLSEDIAAFDINLGCSGFVYGLSVAYCYASQANIRKVLLLNGETKSKAYSSKDKATSLLFGDGATATIIEKTDKVNKTYFTLHSDGSGYDLIIIPGGGYRTPSSIDTLKEKQYEDGSIRTDEQGAMNGPAVFNFAITKVPADIKDIIQKANIEWDDIDYFIPHQANRFITDHIAKKFKLPPSKVLYSIHKFGNTSSVSIPLTIVSELGDLLENHKYKVLLSGFGVGLSWGTVIADLNYCKVASIKEY
ncbi:MAG TPA: ketoacyl-ACP synthase III [Candidatus Cloacimonadota bacterium]|nr:ketoacyl-ACP synthase III [Candidatus Cloacimonadota bacterium]HQL14410.1 ketoacyl-ACP synthase III [Candidatus Cloacimonadota bacterium]